MFNLDLEKTEEPEIKLAVFIKDHRKSKRIPEKNIYFIEYAKVFEKKTLKKNYFYFLNKKLWEILKEMGIPDHLNCLLRSLYAGQEATVRTGHGRIDWFQIRKGVH